MASKGYRTDQASTDRWLSPQNAQTGDGRTRREIHDGVRLETRQADGTKIETKPASRGRSRAEADRLLTEHLEGLSKRSKGKK